MLRRAGRSAPRPFGSQAVQIGVDIDLVSAEPQSCRRDARRQHQMPTIQCPSCGHRGRTELDSEAFEVRGALEGKPVRKCRSCGAGMTVGLGLTGAKAKLIEPALWQEMEASWARAFGDADQEQKSPT